MMVTVASVVASLSFCAHTEVLRHAQTRFLKTMRGPSNSTKITTPTIALVDEPPSSASASSAVDNVGAVALTCSEEAEGKAIFYQLAMFNCTVLMSKVGECVLEV